MTLYNSIGNGYNNTRRADPFIANTLYNLLNPIQKGPYLEIGCGTCNYLQALSERGLRFYGIDPSETMLNEARKKETGATLINGCAENIPIEDDFFYGVTAILTLHHWQDLLKGLKEVHRVLKPGNRLVAFSFSPAQMKTYWLNHYFPTMMERSWKIIPEKEEMESYLYAAGFRDVTFSNYFIQPDLCDHFLYSYKSSPEKYLDENVRKNTSAFAAFSSEAEVENGVEKLKQDIESGQIDDVIKRYQSVHGDYLFFSALK